MTRVVHIITGLETGGAEMMLARILEQSDRRRVEAHVISLSTLGKLGPRLQELGYDVRAMEMKASLPNPVAILRLARILREIRPDVVQTWLYQADLIGSIAARLAGVRTIAWGIHQSNLSPQVNTRRRLLFARACALTSGWLPTTIVVCAEAARASHTAFGYTAGRMQVIPNGFDITRFAPDAAARAAIRSELGVSGDALLIGLTARWDPNKDHQTFIRAAGEIRRRHGNVHFVLCGAGIDAANADLARWIDEAGVRDRVHLLGRRDDVPAINAALDIGCSSSVGEAFPLAVGEAMASGLPCVVTDVGDSALLLGGTGVVVPPSDPHALAEGLDVLLTASSAERSAKGNAARERIATTFSLEAVVDRYESLYERLASDRPEPIAPAIANATIPQLKEKAS